MLTTSYMLQKPRGNAWRDQELGKCEWIATDGIVGNEDWQLSRIGNGEIAYLQYTSGSTSSPKV